MAKPSTRPTWSTDTNYTNGPQSGQPTKQTPSAGFQAEGAIPGDKVPAQFVNWFNYWVGEWVDWLGEDNDHWIEIAPSPEVLDSNSTSYLNQINAEVPDGATITRVRAIVTPGAARTGTNRVGLRFSYRSERDWSTPSGTTITSTTTVYDDGTTALQVIDTGTISVPFDKHRNNYIRLDSGNDASSNNDTVHALRIDYSGRPS